MSEPVAETTNTVLPVVVTDESTEETSKPVIDQNPLNLTGMKVILKLLYLLCILYLISSSH
jgi:hypothetical protein